MNSRDPRTGTEWLIVTGSRVHNLRSVDVAIPKRSLTVFTGVSGSGKSSLAFDTLFAEGQRRYVESLSVYARQFLGRMEKPEVDEIVGLSPTVSIEQKTISHNPRSTVGTITEVYDHLRVLFAQLGAQHCYSCGDPVGSTSAKRIVDTVMELPGRARFMVLAPLVRNRKGEFRDLFDRLRREGFSRVRVDGELEHLDEIDKLRKSYRHDIDVVVDRLVRKDGIEARLAESIESALAVGDGRMIILVDSGDDAGNETLYSTKNHCVRCGISYPPLTHQSFSFNSPVGMCGECRGLGTRAAMDPDKVIPDPSLTIKGGCFEPLRRRMTRAERWNWRLLEAFAQARHIDLKVPWEELPKSDRELLLNGVEEPELLTVKGRKNRVRVRFEGVLPYLYRRLVEADTEAKTQRMAKYLFETPCDSCEGSRIRRESAAVRFAETTLPQVACESIDDAYERFAAIALSGEHALIGDELVAEVTSRLRFLREVGLGYLALNRGGPTLSGGEAQRIRLARQIGSDLRGVLYVLDEPSIGLHQRDNTRLLATLAALRDSGNTVLVVEHDQDTIEAADWIIDFGPGAGDHGGNVTYQGHADGLTDAHESLTADYVSGRKEIAVPSTRRKPGKKHLKVFGARANNLVDVDVSIPCGLLTCVTGVSGAGKSTLINGIVYPAVANHLYKEIRDVAVHRRMTGLDHFDKAIRIDQRPIGRSPRSNPATYTKVFDDIRKIFSSLPEAKIYGYQPGRFSFNVEGGRCEACSGSGVLRIEMHFMADVFVECEQCRGKRFNDATLRVKYRGHSISDVLDMTFEDALELFEPYPRVARILKTVVDVGLGYIRLGQPSPTLSGGEAQRMKLSRELAKIATGDTLYVLDEPSTGLHFDDIQKLMSVLQTLVDAGNTVIVIEHNLDIVKCADHVIDLGPEGGAGGGQVVAVGTPEQVAEVAESHTGTYLRAVLR